MAFPHSVIWAVKVSPLLPYSIVKAVSKGWVVGDIEKRCPRISTDPPSLIMSLPRCLGDWGQEWVNRSLMGKSRMMAWNGTAVIYSRTVLICVPYRSLISISARTGGPLSQSH
jgi:hypothetical protein